MGTAAALVVLRGGAKGGEQQGELETFGRRLAMHVVAARPRFLSANAVPESVAAYERDIIRTQALASGKPAEIVDKMTDGRLRKFFAELSLLDQPHMIEEGNPKVADVATALGKRLGGKVEVAAFVRYKTGEQLLA
jgi:elongation factor Ts